MMASRTGNVAAMTVLLDRGAEVNAKETLRGTTALMWAADQGHAAAVQLLDRSRRRPARPLESGAQPARAPGKSVDGWQPGATDRERKRNRGASGLARGAADPTGAQPAAAGNGRGRRGRRRRLERRTADDR